MVTGRPKPSILLKNPGIIRSDERCYPTAFLCLLLFHFSHVWILTKGGFPRASSGSFQCQDAAAWYGGPSESQPHCAEILLWLLVSTLELRPKACGHRWGSKWRSISTWRFTSAFNITASYNVCIITADVPHQRSMSRSWIRSKVTRTISLWAVPLLSPGLSNALFCGREPQSQTWRHRWS